MQYGSPYRAPAPAGPDPDIEVLARSLVRWVRVLAVLAFVIPGALLALFERQARRLDALADHGAVVDAIVTGRSPSTAYYSYTVDGVAYSWSVASDEAPSAQLVVRYLPERPSFSLPGSEPSHAVAKAAENRRFAWKAVGGVFWFFFANTIVFHVRLRRLRLTGKKEADDPHAHRTRLTLTAVLLVVPALVLIVGWHASDAIRRNEATWRVALGAALSLVVLLGTGFYVMRAGAAHAAGRSARILRWAVPLAVALAILGALAWIARGSA